MNVIILLTLFVAFRTVDAAVGKNELPTYVQGPFRSIVGGPDYTIKELCVDANDEYEIVVGGTLDGSGGPYVDANMGFVSKTSGELTILEWELTFSGLSIKAVKYAKLSSGQEVVALVAF